MLGLVVGRGAAVGVEVVLGPPVTEGERVANHDPARAGHPGRLEDVGPGLVPAADRRQEAGWPEAPEAGAAVEQRAEDARRVEAGQAEPLDRALRGDQCAAVAVGEEPVRRDPREARLERGHAPETIWRRSGGRLGAGERLQTLF